MGTIVRTFCVLMVLIILLEAIVLEGRQLREVMELKKQQSTLSHDGAKEVEANPMASFLEDFRPTSPGHSPGIGHMMENKFTSIGRKVK